MSERLVVIGGDAGGMSAASIARRREPELEIVCLDRGAHTSYSRCGIPYYLEGLVAETEALVSRSPDEHRERGLDVRMRHEVTELDLDARELVAWDAEARQKRRLGFDRLVYATGAHAVMPPIPGTEAAAPVRGIEEAERFAHALRRDPGRHAVVIGASYIGLEMAEALVERGLRVTLLDRLDQVFPGLDPDMAAHVQDAAEGFGIDVVLSATVEAIHHDAGRPRAVQTTAGELPADHVILATGVRPAVELAVAAGLAVDETDALAVDERQRCRGADGVWAAGDCVSSLHRVLGAPRNIQLGTHANKQGRVAGTNATGGDVRFPGVIGTAISRVCHYEVGRTGISEREAAEAGIDVVARTVRTSTRSGYFPGSGPIWVKLVVAPASGRLLGGQIVGVEGAGKRIDVLATAVWNEMTVGELEWVDLSYAPPFSGVYDPVLVAAHEAAKGVAGAAAPA